MSRRPSGCGAVMSYCSPVPPALWQPTHWSDVTKVPWTVGAPAPIHTEFVDLPRHARDRLRVGDGESGQTQRLEEAVIRPTIRHRHRGREATDRGVMIENRRESGQRGSAEEEVLAQEIQKIPRLAFHVSQAREGGIVPRRGVAVQAGPTETHIGEPLRRFGRPVGRPFVPAEPAPEPAVMRSRSIAHHDRGAAGRQQA